MPEMPEHPRRRPSAPLVISLLALVLALVATGAPATAARLITGQDVRNGSLTGLDVKDGSLRAADLADGAAGVTFFGRKRVLASAGDDYTASLAAAKKVVLLRQGPITVYGKCFMVGTTINYVVAVSTKEDGVLMDSREDSLVTEGSFLDVDTPETDRIMEEDSASAGTADSDAEDSSDFLILAPDGTTIRGWSGGALKTGALPGGNGPFGAGKVCLFTGGAFHS
ncbi:hypothetical protein [Nocardioides bruguierae]|uniref:Uncharacterized protein n=1 Tax=Nocardioides bruguierae TaxID=2945102 RepID=A0A9X2D651_9ACTN|nr:hypothetical protein [Nocardioides bruguierae]MCM0620068.1 hypothetical protein [Nocardioides bruguierae]